MTIEKEGDAYMVRGTCQRQMGLAARVVLSGASGFVFFRGTREDGQC